jgi:hypothetical protein
MLVLDPSSQVQAVRHVLASGGPRAALALLNDRTNYRFSALYRRRGDLMHAVHAFDRTSEYRTWLVAVPLDRSFCQYAMQQGEFMTRHASADGRLTQRPYSGMIESYFGRVLRGPDGAAWGTFIHFDLEPREIDEAEIGFLRDVIPLFSPYLN